MPVKALYPGTFDPPTGGHVDLIQRGAKLFDRLTVAILVNPVKNPLFTVEERVVDALLLFNLVVHSTLSKL